MHSKFRTLNLPNGCETYITLEAPRDLYFTESLKVLLSEYREIQEEQGLGTATEVYIRFHLSDISNQTKVLHQLVNHEGGIRLVSVVGQAPASGSKVALEAHHIHPTDGFSKSATEEGSILIKHGEYESLWTNTRPSYPASSFRQTNDIFSQLSKQLHTRKGNIERDTIRTWIYVRDIDNNYQGVVDARRELFDIVGMVKGTHYITSTGIEGSGEDVTDLVLMDSLSILGLQPGQIDFLSAPDYLGPTHDYNVTFERGTRVVYGDRSHFYISGTASIDNQGNVLHVGDVEKQAARALKNIQALLGSKGSDLSDLHSLTVYLRDISEWGRVQKFLQNNIPENIPCITVRGAVCRPLWLIEMEGVAISSNGSDKFRPFL